LRRAITISILIFLLASSIIAQDKKFIALGINSGFSFLYNKSNDDLGPFIGGNIQFHFSKHWAIQPEINFYYPHWGSFLPFVNIIYYFKGLRKQNFFPYLSLGVGGRIELLEDEYGIFFTQMKMGMRSYIIRSSETGLALNLGVSSIGVSSIRVFLFHPVFFSLCVAIEFCVFN